MGRGDTSTRARPRAPCGAARARLREPRARESIGCMDDGVVSDSERRGYGVVYLLTKVVLFIKRTSIKYGT